MSSKRRQRRKECGKVAYSTESDARAACLAASRRGERVLPYRCHFCHQFHIGHPPKRVRQAIASRRRGIV